MNCLAYSLDGFCIIIFLYYHGRLQGWSERAERTWESVLTRSIVPVVGNEYSGIVVIVTGTLLTSNVLQAIPQVIAVSRSQVSLSLKRLGSFKVLRTLGAPLSPRMSDAHVNAPTTIESTLFPQTLRLARVEAGNNTE